MIVTDGPGLRCIDRTVITPDGVRLAVRDYPAADEEVTAVLLHGFCLNQNSWNGQVHRLRRRWDSRMRTITYDHRGHGQSATAPNRTYRVPTLADDLNTILAALHVRTPLVIIGHSMGGMTALTFAGRPTAEQAVPADGLVLVATAAGRLTERGIGRLLAIPTVGALPALLGHVPAQLLRAWPLLSAANLPAAAAARPPHATPWRRPPPRRSPRRRWPRPSASYPPCATTTPTPSYPPSPHAPSSCPAAPTRSPHRRTPRTWQPASPERSTCTYPTPATC